METKNNHNKQQRKSLVTFLLCLGLAIGLALLIKEPGFTDSQGYALFLLFFAIGLWFTEVIPPFAVGLFIMAFLVFSLGDKKFNSVPVKIDMYLNTFSSSVIWLMLGGFFLGAAMTKTKLDQELFKFSLKISGTKPRKLLIGLMATTMVASMLMSNTATTAMVIAAVTPLINSLGKKSGFTKALLLGIPIAATIGGMGTIIGTPTNAIAVGILENNGIKIDFLHWMVYGVPLALVLTSVGYIVLVLLYVKDNQHISTEFINQQDSELNPEIKTQRRIVVTIILVTVILWLTSSLHGIGVAGVSAIPIVFLTLTKILKEEDIRALPWDTLLLVAGGLSLGIALQQTGLLDHYAGKLSGIPLGEIGFIFLFAYLTMVFSNIMSNTATSTVLIPLGMAILIGMKTEIALIIGLCASTALFLPVSTPPNAIAYSTGLIEQKDFRVGGFLIGLLGPALIIFYILLMT